MTVKIFKVVKKKALKDLCHQTLGVLIDSPSMLSTALGYKLADDMFVINMDIWGVL